MADNQDPLAALQQLLDDQKKQGAAAPGAVTEDDAPAAEPEVEEPKGPSAEEIAKLQQVKLLEDQQKIAEQLEKMRSELTQTPQYQARMSQKEASDALSQEKSLEERSKRIFQLKRLDK
jgi:hypothetical protein